MIIGHGDIAQALKAVDSYDRLYFSSGVSNSGETRQSEFDRELELLKKQDRSEHLVYFSSLCIYNSNTKYAEHKRNMERQVQWYFETYTIIRLGNINWGVNPHTFINYIKAHPNAEIFNEYRHVLDKEEFLHWIMLIPDESDIMNIPGKFVYVPDYVRTL